MDWESLGFEYIKTKFRFVAEYKDGGWKEGYYTEDENIIMNESAGVLQYAQTCFEGLKAYRTVDGRIVTFRPNLNAKRFADSCKRLEIPAYSEEDFIESILGTVRKNIEYVPPYGQGASLYIRPYAFGIAPVIGVKPSSEYQYRVFTTPVGAYFKGGARGIRLKVSDYDRAAPNGTGNIKAGLNYAMSLYPLEIAHREGYAENMYLDARTRTKIEETGGANFIFVGRDGEVITPKSDTILPSVTRKSILYVAENILGLQVIEREVYVDELEYFEECGLCGTAAVISPVASVTHGNKEISFKYGKESMGPTLSKLYETLIDIQLGKREAPDGWIYEV